ncbi:MAG: acylphosphatase [Bacteroidales bacterium]|nr:acylphosphatase [Bacteroidales bacterium]
MNKKSVILQIYGRVQGVGFRYYTEKKAKELNLTGFVRNRPDGSVYVEAEGRSEDLELFMIWCQQGPDWARVSRVNQQFVPLQNFTRFEIR